MQKTHRNWFLYFLTTLKAGGDKRQSIWVRFILWMSQVVMNRRVFRYGSDDVANDVPNWMLTTSFCKLLMARIQRGYTIIKCFRLFCSMQILCQFSPAIFSNFRSYFVSSPLCFFYSMCFFLLYLCRSITSTNRTNQLHTFPQWATVKYVTVAKVDGYQTIYARKLRIIGNSFWWLAFWCTRLTCAMDMAVWLNHRADHQHFDMDFKHRQIIMIMNYTAVDLRDSKKTEESVENAVMPGVSWIEFDFGWAFFDFELQ